MTPGRHRPTPILSYPILLLEGEGEGEGEGDGEGEGLYRGVKGGHPNPRRGHPACIPGNNLKGRP